MSRPLPLRRKISHAPWFDACDVKGDAADPWARARRGAHPFAECGRNVAFVSGLEPLAGGRLALAYGVGDREARVALLRAGEVRALFD